MAEFTTDSVAESATLTEANSATRKEQTIEHINEQTTVKRKLVQTRPKGVSEELWRDYLILQKATGKPLTNNELKGIHRQASLTGINLSDAFEKCCVMGWQGT